VPSLLDNSGPPFTRPARSVEIVGEDVADRWPLPSLEEATSKVQRGTVLIVGGSIQTPGAVLLAGIAALRAGAGRLQIATTGPTAVGLAVGIPEARVIGLGTVDAEIDPRSIDQIASNIARAETILLGTGTLDAANAAAVALAVVERMGSSGRVVFDAGSLALVPAESGVIRSLGDRAILIPNVTEAGHLLDCEPAAVEASAPAALTELVDDLQTVVTLRMATTYTAGSTGPIYRDDCGPSALATAGSGDVFAGILAGMLTSGAPSLSATIRAVRCHGLSGHAAVQRIGGHSILARDLLQEIPCTSAR